MSDKYKLTVGLEIHAELNTRTKMFCNSKNNPDENRPNVNICPVCMGHPGTLPVINKEAVRSVLRLGVAVGGQIADYTEFDRKNYFYPDIPKGYQISQYKYPLVSGGEVAGVPLTRVHLEEDTAKSSHDNDGVSLVDFNRAGVPLMELVTEPEIHDAETAGCFAREFQLLLLYLGISHANMEKGEMRVEANISVSKNDKLGTKVEVKNLNSFKSVERAIRYEYERQVDLLESGQGVIQETRGWDENKGKTFSQRAKEESHDYRYFPDPDLPKLLISEIPEFSQVELNKSLPELPNEKRARLQGFGLKDEQTEVFINNFEKSAFLEEVIRELGHSMSKDKTSNVLVQAANYITTDLKGSVPTKDFTDLMKMLSADELSSRATKDILIIMQEKGGKPRDIAIEKNLLQLSNKEELMAIAKEVLSEKSDAPKPYLVGQAMKKSGGRANPKVLNEVFDELLK